MSNNCTSLNPQQEQHDIQDAILFPWFVELLGVCSLFLLKRFRLPIPYVAVMFILGAIMGAGAALSGLPDRLTSSINMWTQIDSQALLLIFLPGLIFRDAIEININLFLVAIGQILILAFPMVLLGTFLTALVGIFVLPYNWSASQAATLGAILASTDPIAVSSVMKSAGAPRRLVMHLSGESLLNDGSAVVFYTIFSQMYLSELGIGEPVSVGEGFIMFFRMAIGGVVVGLAFGLMLLGILYELDRRMEPDYNILQVVAALTIAYISYYVADQPLRMSGVTSCVMCGVTAKAFGFGLINDEKMMIDYLALMEHLLNSLLFALGGVVWGRVCALQDEAYDIRPREYGYLLLLYSLVVLIRFCQVAVFYPILSRIGLKSGWQEAIFLSYAGLRGSVGVALALSLTRSVFQSTNNVESQKLTTLLEFMAGGVTLCTLVINGTTAERILKWLNLNKPTVSRELAVRQFEISAEAFVHKECQGLLQESRFQHVDFSVLSHHVKFLKSEPVGRMEEANEYDPRHRRKFTLPSSRDIFIRGLSQNWLTSSEGEILLEIRRTFLSLLNDAYRLQLKLGELDEREDNGYIFSVLTQSVDLASTDVEHKGPIDDWTYTQIFPTVLNDVGHRASFGYSPGVHSNFVHRDESQYVRVRVLIAIAFVEAHQMARTKLEEYCSLLEPQPSLDVAIETVLKESLDQVEAANDCLRQEVSDQNLRLILSHYCSRILLRRLVHFVEQRAEDGLLSKEEASAYFRDMDSSIREVMKCCGHMISQDQSKALDDEEGLCCQCSKFCIRDVNAEASENKGS